MIIIQIPAILMAGYQCQMPMASFNRTRRKVSVVPNKVFPLQATKRNDYSTDCVREIAKILDIPMALAIGRIQNVHGAFASIYRESRKSVKRPAKVVAREVLSL